LLYYINDLPKNVHDDTSVLISDSDARELQIKTDTVVTELETWLSRNDLVINTGKTGVMSFHNGQPHFLAKPLVTFNNTTVAYTSDTKFLGIRITDSLKWHSHIQLLANKLSKVTFMIKSLKEILSSNFIRNIYFTKFHSLLWFGILCWRGGSRSELTSKILRIKKRVMRLIAGVNPRTPCRKLFKELNILTIVSLYILELISYLRRHHQFVQLNSNVHTYNTRTERDIHIQSYNTDLYKRSVVNMGSKVYNKLPNYLKETESYKIFRKELKSFLLQHVFYSEEEFVALQLLLDQLKTEVSFLQCRYSDLISLVVCYSIPLLIYLSLCIFLAIDKSTVICTILRLINKLNYDSSNK